MTEYRATYSSELSSLARSACVQCLLPVRPPRCKTRRKICKAPQPMAAHGSQHTELRPPRHRPSQTKLDRQFLLRRYEQPLLATQWVNFDSPKNGKPTFFVSLKKAVLEYKFHHVRAIVASPTSRSPPRSTILRPSLVRSRACTIHKFSRKRALACSGDDSTKILANGSTGPV